MDDAGTSFGGDQWTALSLPLSQVWPAFSPTREDLVLWYQ